MSAEELAVARSKAEAGLAAARRTVGELTDSIAEADGLAGLGDRAESGRSNWVRHQDRLGEQRREAAQEAAWYEKQIAEIEAAQHALETFDPMAPSKPSPAPRPQVESVVDDLGDGRGVPIRPGSRIPAAALAAAVVVVVVVILSTAGIVWRNSSGHPTPAPTQAARTAAPAQPTTAPVALTTPTPNPISGAVALHGEGNTVPPGAGCSHPGNVHFTWTVRDANPGDRVVVALTGAGMPPTVELTMPADLKPVVEVPLPLNTSARWTAHVESIAGKRTNDSIVWTASTGATCNA